MYVVIMAGGGGTRLWPLSRPDRPKPFLPLLGEATLFQQTVARAEAAAGPGNVYCVTDRRYGHLVQSQAPGVRLLVEPTGRNTAAAIALGTSAIARPDDEVMAVLPADHAIRDEQVFVGVLRDAERELATGFLDVESPLVTLGVQVSRPATEFGYLLPNLDRVGRGSLTGYVLRAFEEKPAQARAEQLWNEPGVAWNAGIFLWRRRAIRAALEKYTPLMTLIGPAVGSDIALAGAYERITPVSVDHAVMEGAAAHGQVVMGAMDVGWSDLGSWTALLAALAGGDAGGASGRVHQPGEGIELGGDDLLVRPSDGRLIVDEPAQGTIVADGVWAHLAGARHLADRVRALLDRVQGQESRP